MKNKNETYVQDIALNEQESYSQKKHEQWNTPRNVINDAVKEATGSQMKERNRIIVGETNEVYEAVTEAGQEVMVRIFHGEKNKFDKEKWALERCKEKGVLVPTIFSIKSIEYDNGPIHICVESKLKGVNLYKISGAVGHETSSEVADMLRQLGGMLSKVHSIKTNGFGKLDKDGNGMFASVSELIKGDRKISREKILPAFSGKPEETKVLEDAYEILAEESGKYSQTEPRLIHNDISPEHVLIDDGNVSGLVDFESAFGSDPIQDFALWDFKHGKAYPLKYIKEGYGNPEMFLGDFERKLNFWKIYRAMGSLSYCLKEKKQKRIDKIIKIIDEASRFFA